MILFSHSRLSTYEQCKLKYKFKYVDKIQPVTEQSIEAFLGTLVHETLEKLYRDLKFQTTNTLESLLEWYRKEWKRSWNDGIIIVRKEYGQENYRKMGEQFIRDYYRRYKPFDHSRTIGLEMKVRIKLDEAGRHVLRGYIDRLTFRDGVYEVHDYKTNANLPITEYLEDDRQLALYAIAVKTGYQDAKKVRLVWHFLAHDKEIILEKSDSQLECLKKETIELIEKIRREKDFKPTLSKLCDWCEFRPDCPMWSHIQKVENLEPNKYLRDPGVKLVNKYAELKTKKEEFCTEIDSELEKLKEAIVKFSDKENADVIAGSDIAVKVWKAILPKVPGKNEELRPELEEVLKKEGKWDEVSMLDAFLLSNIIKSESWSKETLKKLEKYIGKERVERLYLRKLD
jgi:putative RecB family exonuclease